MSLPTEAVQQQIVRQYPEKFREPFLEALRDKELKLQLKEINDSQLIEYVIPFLNNNPSVTTLDVSQNQIGVAGAQALADTNLTTLNISYNPIRDAGVQALALSKTLRALNVSACGIGVAGAQALADATLTTLNISYN